MCGGRVATLEGREAPWASEASRAAVAGGWEPAFPQPGAAAEQWCSGFSPWGFEFLLCLCFILLCPSSLL